MTLKEIAKLAIDESDRMPFAITEDKGTHEGAIKGWVTRRRNASCLKDDDAGKKEREEMRDRVKSWLSQENLDWARGKSREEIFDKFGNELVPVSVISRKYLDYLDPKLIDNRVYCGQGYMIDHAVNHHPELTAQEYDDIQAVIDNPDDVKLDDRNEGRPSLVFIKLLDAYTAVVVGVNLDEQDRIVYHKTFFKRNKNAPYPKMQSIFKKS